MNFGVAVSDTGMAGATSHVTMLPPLVIVIGPCVVMSLTADAVVAGVSLYRHHHHHHDAAAATALVII